MTTATTPTNAELPARTVLTVFELSSKSSETSMVFLIIWRAVTTTVTAADMYDSLN